VERVERREGVMVLEQRMVGGVAVLDMSGRLTLGDGDDLLKDKVNSLVHQGMTQIALNLGQLSYIDSSGLGSLVSSFSTVTRAGGRIKMFNLTRRISDLMSITKLLTVFDVYDSEQAALESFSAGTP
jgi:anti-sigma B factor antagonist